MAIPGQDHAFVREEVFPSWFANRVQDMLSAGKFDLVISRKNATTIQVVPDAILGIAAVNIKGRWRFNSAAVERAPSGGKATLGIWAVAEDNAIDNIPNPFTDHTAYAFDLRISATEPAVGAGTAINQKIGEVDWSGTEIEAIRQNRGAVTGAQLADGTFANSTQVEWKREPGGAMVSSLVPAVAEAVGINSPGIVRGGSSIIAAEGEYGAVGYGKMATPDRVQNVVVPANGLLRISFSALVKTEGPGAAQIAVFIGANQLKIPHPNGAAEVQAAWIAAASGFWTPLVSGPAGLACASVGAADSTLVTTGQIIGAQGNLNKQFFVDRAGVFTPLNVAGATIDPYYGGFIFAEVAAGTYEVSIQYKMPEGGVIKAKERKLRARAEVF